MVLRLLSFNTVITENIARGLRTVEGWLEMCSATPPSWSIDGHASVPGKDGNIHLVFMARGGKCGIEMKLDADSALMLHESLSRALGEMKGNIIDEMIASMTEDETQEIADVIGGMFSGGPLAES